MPFTPFHIGPTLLIGLFLFSSLDLFSFLLASVIVDLEPFYLMTQHVSYLHGFLHSYLGASILVIPLAIGVFSMRVWLEKILKLFRIEQKSSFQKILFSSLLGAYSHVFLDSFLYAEMTPFYPLEPNPFLNVVSSSTVYGLCGISFLLGIIVYLNRLRTPRST